MRVCAGCANRNEATGKSDDEFIATILGIEKNIKIKESLEPVKFAFIKEKGECKMTIEEQAAQAGELKATGQCNCTQSVLCPCPECVRNAVLALGAG